MSSQGNNIRLKKGIFFFLLFFLFVSLMQNKFSIVELSPLGGAFKKSEKPNVWEKDWYEAEYQQEFEQYHEESFGFRNLLIRLNNQIQYSAFNKANMSGAEVGKSEQLFHSDYIDSYLGRDYIGYDSIQIGIEKIDYVKNRFEENGVNFLVIIAPGKASFMPENIPSKYRLEEKDTSNYEMYIKGLEEKGVNTIDFRSYFNSIKGKVKYPLFPKGGAHWNGYAISIAADTLIKHIEKSYALNLNSFIDLGGELVSTPRATDAEISNGMNLMIPFKSDELYYPKIEFKNENNNDKPNVLIVGDSYAETFYNFYPFYKNIFGANTNYWSYNIWEKWPINQNKEKHRVVNLDMKEQLLSRDLVIVLVTQINLKFLGELFIDRQYDFFKDLDNDVKYQNEIQRQKEVLIAQGINKNLSLEKEARILVNRNFFKLKEKLTSNSLKNREGYERDVLQIIARIKEDESWFAMIKKQAKDRNVTIDTMLESSAKYVLNNR